MFDFIASHVIGSHWNKTREEELSLTLKEPLSRLTAQQRETIMNTSSTKELMGILKATGLLSSPGNEENGNKKS
jgi:hypothetical protein